MLTKTELLNFLSDDFSVAETFYYGDWEYETTPSDFDLLSVLKPCRIAYMEEDSDCYHTVYTFTCQDGPISTAFVGGYNSLTGTTYQTLEVTDLREELIDV